jgi:TPR repeat protein
MTGAIVIAAGGLPGLAQEGSTGVPDLETMEAQLEEAFQEALAMSEEEPMHVLQAWGSVLMNAAVLERIRAMSEMGEGAEPPPLDHQAVTESVLARWQRLRPESGGPDLLRALQIRDPAEKRAAVVALLDRHPDEPLVVWQATNELRQAGETRRATEELESFLARDPSRPLAYRFLAQDARDNETRLAEVLERWARAVPSDPEMALHWLQSSLPRREPEATARMLDDLFAGGPAGEAGLRACLQVARMPDTGYAARARGCVARFAGDPEAPARLSEDATSALVGFAAADGDWSALLAALDALEPADRVRALVSAAGRLDAPDRCVERLDLLTVAAEALGEDGNYRSASTVLLGCARLPAARELFLDLLRRAPASRVADVLGAWTSRVNGVLRGELPAGAAAVLEGRLEQEPPSSELLGALDLVYELTGEDGRRFELLRRWHRLDPESLRREHVAALAHGLADRGEPEAGMELLEARLESRFEPEVVDALWLLYVEGDHQERAERFAADLMARGEPWRDRVGHLLAARSALVRENLAAAEAHYWKFLEEGAAGRAVAVELLAAISWHGDTERLEPTARRICEETALAGEADEVPGCAADLLTRAGRADAATGLLAARAADLPEDVESLRELARTAQAAGEAEVAERALRQALELDPRSEESWTGLGRFLEEQGRAEEVAELLERSRERFSPPPSYLYRSAGRALTAAGEPGRAIEVLTEARGTLPDGEGGDWSRGWIDHELREAYRVLGQQSGAAPATLAPASSPAFATSQAPDVPATATAAEVRGAANALYSGEGGRYDPVAAEELFRRAASTGDPLATFRLAVMWSFDPSKAPADGPGPDELYRRSVEAVAAKAEEGDAFARYLMGAAALTGLGGREDFGTARRWLEQAAAQGESWAWHNLGWMEETGRGFERSDPESALASYRRAAEAGNTQSMNAFARLTLDWGASGALCEEGLRWLERSAGAGNAAAASFLGKLLFYGRGECVARDPAAARPWLEAALATRRPGAAYDLGLALVLEGPNATARARGLSLLEGDAAGPGALGAETLAFLHATGSGVERDSARARELMEEAARLGSDGFPRLREDARRSVVPRQLLDEGLGRLEELAGRSDAPAMAFLARLYALGFGRHGHEVEPERTVALARQAAAAGEPLAMRVLTDAYLSGNGVEADPAEALRWRRRCAEAGDSFCMMFLGQDLMKGERVERDVQAGLQWLRRAGEAGNWWAVADLGNLYAEGWHGIPSDPDEAAAWKRRLADLGDPEATGWLVAKGYR